jgi:Tol biopolymer transport system component
MPFAKSVYDYDAAAALSGVDVAYFVMGNRVDERDGVWIFNLDSGSRRFLAPGMDPCWSQDGRLIAYSYGGSIRAQAVDGLTAPIVISPARDFWYPSFSPDGGKIVCQRTSPVDSCGLWVFRVGTGEPPYRFIDDVAAGQPAWSPDGLWVAYLHRTTPVQPELRVVSADGMTYREFRNAGNCKGGRPRWSPGSNRLVVGTNQGIVLVDFPTGSVVLLAGTFEDSLGDPQSGCFARGGEWIVYNKETLRLIRSDGTEDQSLTHAPPSPA